MGDRAVYDEAITLEQYHRWRNEEPAARRPPAPSIDTSAEARTCALCDAPIDRYADPRRVFCSARCRVKSSRLRAKEREKVDELDAPVLDLTAAAMAAGGVGADGIELLLTAVPRFVNEHLLEVEVAVGAFTMKVRRPA